MSGIARVTDGGGNTLEVRSDEIGTPEYYRKIARWRKRFIPGDPDAVPMKLVDGKWVRI